MVAECSTRKVIHYFHFLFLLDTNIMRRHDLTRILKCQEGYQIIIKREI